MTVAVLQLLEAAEVEHDEDEIEAGVDTETLFDSCEAGVLLPVAPPGVAARSCEPVD